MVLDEQGRVSVDLRTDGRGNQPASGTIAIYAEPKNALGEAGLAAVKLSAGAGKGGFIETLGPLGARSVQLFGDESGGQIQFFDAAGRKKNMKLQLVLNHTQENARDNQTSVGATNAEDNPRQASPRPPVPPEVISTEAEGN